jgi:hypothetical protein
MLLTRHVTTSLCDCLQLLHPLSCCFDSILCALLFHRPSLRGRNATSKSNDPCHSYAVVRVLPATLRRGYGCSHRAWHGTTSRFMRHTLEKAGRSSVFEFKSYGGWRCTIGRVCCRTRLGIAIGWRCRTVAPEITQPGAYTENIQPCHAAQRTLYPMRTALRNTLFLPVFL